MEATNKHLETPKTMKKISEVGIGKVTLGLNGLRPYRVNLWRGTGRYNVYLNYQEMLFLTAVLGQLIPWGPVEIGGPQYMGETGRRIMISGVQELQLSDWIDARQNAYCVISLDPSCFRALLVAVLKGILNVG